MPWSLDDLDTPAVLVDLDKVGANLRRAQAYADAHELVLRPHIKTHKIPEFAKKQVELGAIGITCQKLGEAEVMARISPDERAARGWAAAQADLSARARRGRAVNLDPSALVMDMLLTLAQVPGNADA